MGWTQSAWWHRIRHLMVLACVLPCAIGAQDAPPHEVVKLQLPDPVVLRTAGPAPSAGFRFEALSEAELGPGHLGPGSTARFYDRHLVPRLSRYLDRIAPMHLESDLGGNVHLNQHVLYTDFTDAAQRRATKGLSRAVRSYLLETPLLDRFNRRLQLSADRVRDAASSGSEGSSWRLSGDFSHGRPELGLEYERGRRQLGFRIDAFGTAAIELRHLEHERLRLVAEYDAREEVYDVFCRLRF